MDGDSERQKPKRDSPILVKTSFDLLGEMLRPDGLEGPHAVGRLDVADDADHHDGRGLDDGHRLDHFLLVRLGSGPIHQTANMRHTGLPRWRGEEMRWKGNEMWQ